MRQELMNILLKVYLLVPDKEMCNRTFVYYNTQHQNTKIWIKIKTKDGVLFYHPNLRFILKQEDLM